MNLKQRETKASSRDLNRSIHSFLREFLPSDLKNQRKTKTISCKSNRWIKNTKAKEKRERERERVPSMALNSEQKLWISERERLNKNAKIWERERERLKKNAKICEREREREWVSVCVCVLCEFWEVKRNGGFWLNGSLNCEECEPSDWNLEIAVVSNGYIIYQFSFWSVACLFSIYMQVCIFWNFWVSGAAQ